MPIQLTQTPNRRAALIHFGCFLPPLRSPRDGAIGDLLAQLMERRLFDGLRAQVGRSYTLQVVASQLWGGTAMLDGALDIDDDAVGMGVDAVRALLQEDGPPPFDMSAIEQTRWRLALGVPARLSSNTLVARALFAAWKLGWPPTALEQLPSDLAAVGASELEVALRACRASAVVSVEAALGASLP